MKRTPLPRALEPGEAEWKRRRYGYCEVCAAYGPIVLHHVVDKNRVRRETTAEQQEAGIVWDQRNALRVGAPYSWGGRCRCHDNQEAGTKRVPYSKVPAAAVEYAREVLGEGPAVEYLRKHYGGAP